MKFTDFKNELSNYSDLTTLQRNEAYKKYDGIEVDIVDCSIYAVNTGHITLQFPNGNHSYISFTKSQIESCNLLKYSENDDVRVKAKVYIVETYAVSEIKYNLISISLVRTGEDKEAESRRNKKIAEQNKRNKEIKENISLSAWLGFAFGFVAGVVIGFFRAFSTLTNPHWTEGVFFPTLIVVIIISTIIGYLVGIISND